MPKYIITTKSKQGKTVYFDGFSWSLLRVNAKEMDAHKAISERSNMCKQFPDCILTNA